MAYTEESLRREIRNNETKIGNIKRENETLEGQLSRIRRAKKTISQAKNDYKRLRDSTQKVLNNRDKWKGEQYEKCESAFRDVEYADDNAVSRIDQVLDALERAEGEYERKMNSNKGLIRSLQNGINWAWHEIKTLFN